jgi:hypothetical protein
MMSAMRLSAVALVALSTFFFRAQPGEVRQPTLGHRSVPLLTVGGLQFKDLNRNGKLANF